ncbi:hypothetical protein GF354_00015 [Candidatus Peregrinibacteria bacterium]|nr:hypothetical protein [Candidatus Peregrinibacteria bacterium]
MKRIILPFILLVSFGACGLGVFTQQEPRDLDSETQLFEEDGYYVNEKYSFKVKLLEDFKTEVLPSGEGIKMVRWVTPDPPTKEEKLKMDKDWDERYDGYRVILQAKAGENYMEYEDLGEFIVDKFSDYNKEFYKDGVIILQSAGGDSLKRYFVMNKKASIIYELSLEVKSYHFSDHEYLHTQMLDSFSF